MGCFSFICKECGEPVLSNSFRGQRVNLYLLMSGGVVQSMSGEYDSYGRVFNDDLSDSLEWSDPFPEKKTLDGEADKHIDFMPDAWSKVCDLMFDSDKSNGIAAVHSKCFTGEIPKTRSDDDPNQGWGEEGELMGDCDDDREFF